MATQNPPTLAETLASPVTRRGPGDESPIVSAAKRLESSIAAAEQSANDLAKAKALVSEMERSHALRQKEVVDARAAIDAACAPVIATKGAGGWGG